MIAGLARWGRLGFAGPARLAALLLAYVALHAASRLWILPPSLGYDDAEQVLSAQAWAWAYRFQQPPLVTWLLLALRDGTGLEPSLASLTLLRSLLLVALYVFTFLAARRLLGDLPRAGVAAAGLSATYTLGWLAHADLTHSIALAVAVAAALWLWQRLLERPSLARTLAFALACGLGLLAKWNFVMLVAGLAVVGLLRPATRPLALSWRTPLIALVMVLVAGPSAFWVASQTPSLLAVGERVLATPSEEADEVACAEGLAALALSALAFPQPLLVLAVLVLTPAWRAPRREASWLAVLMATVLALHALLVPLAGATEFPERWMIVPLLPLSLLLVAAALPQDRRVFALGGAFLVLALSVLALRVGIGVTNAHYCGKCRTRLPAPAFAEALRQAGFQEGTLVTFDMHLAGNLKLHLPAARVVVPSLPSGAWPPPGEGKCAVLWRGGAVPEARLAEVGAALGVAWGAAPARWVEAPILGNAERTQTVGFKLVPGAGSCR